MNAQAKLSQPNIVNGLNVDDLMTLIDDVSKDTAKAKTNWHVATTWMGQTSSRSQISGFGFGGKHVSRPFALDVDEPHELGGSNMHANPQEYLITALNACMLVGFVAQCAVRGITLESLEIETEGDIDLRGFLGIDPTVANGYEHLRTTIRIKGNGTEAQFAEIQDAVMATSPNFYNVTKPVAVRPTLIVA